jgi:glutamate--cysteine ligase catalytic subunit
MGLLTTGEPLDWPETKKHAHVVRRRGVEQFIKLYKAYKSRDLDSFKYGDEVEYSLVKFDHKETRVYCLLKAQQVLAKLMHSSKHEDGSSKPETLWSPEFANFMVEGLPGRPYGDNVNCISDIEANMAKRRALVQELLDANEYCMTFSTFPLLGCPDFTWPHHVPTPGRGITNSMFFPDQAVFQGHPRYAASLINNRERRQVRNGSHIPVFVDERTPRPFRDTYAQYAACDEQTAAHGAAKADHIYLEGIGASCSCLQMTFQAKNLEEARRLYDQLAPVTPIMLALSASSPIWRGHLSEIDCRWRVISESLDDRTAEEKGHAPLVESGSGKSRRIFKSRYDSVDCYLSEEGAQFNDIEIVRDEEAYMVKFCLIFTLTISILNVSVKVV